jgi:hypothetical protein
MKAITVGTDEFQLTPLPQVSVAASLHGYKYKKQVHYAPFP